MNFRKLVYLLAIFVCCPTIVMASVTDYELDNGLKLIVKQDRRAPIAMSQIWYKVGSRQEHKGITGISHLLEHLMFKGSNSFPDSSFVDIVERHGGKYNAFTSRDFTVYYQELAADKVELFFKLEADRMNNLNWQTEAFEKEKQVVKEERFLRVDDKPEGLLQERFQALAFPSTGYQNPVIGWMEDLDTMSMEQVKTWYNKYYAPNNAVVVVVGNVQPQQILELAKQYFGPISGKQLENESPNSQSAFGQRQVDLQLPAHLSQLTLGFNVPSVNTSEDKSHPYALEVLLSILDGGQSSRVHKSLVLDKRLASKVDSSYDLFNYHSSLFTLSAIPSTGIELDILEKSLLDVIYSLQENPVTSEELSMVKQKVIAQNIFAKDSLFHQAYLIGALEINGYGWQEFDNYVNKIQDINIEQVQQVVAKYLNADNLTVARLRATQQQGAN